MDTNNEIKIEKGIPLPMKRSRSGGTSDMLRKMESGESFVIPKGKRNNILCIALRLKIKVTSRSISAEEVRIWRTE